MSPSLLLSLRDLTVDFATRHGPVQALDGLSLDIFPGEIVGVVGESGSGKSAMAHAVMGLLPDAARIRDGDITFDGRDLRAMGPRARDAWRGREVAMVFQNPRAALNPLRSIGDQLMDVIARHRPVSAVAARRLALETLGLVRFPDPERRIAAYPWELSVGQCQRVGIALALASGPRLLIADEPTTGLDVTTQAGILDLIRGLARDRGMSVLFISHDLALASEYCDRLVILHAGQIAEVAPTQRLLEAPRHPYSKGLLRAAPALARRLEDLHAIEGALPDLRRPDLPPCRFAERCPRRQAACDAGPVTLQHTAGGHLVACRNPL